ncbi:hypothetical protein [Nonlabens xiamenensis]|uniref:hypothetical protein n=1 Tax=Nonlabens xiamenensis TaxID=2341043 RepID=UPI000F6091D2|nr:hypothetical protein [Nonlabens xiamenensis]
MIAKRLIFIIILLLCFYSIYDHIEEETEKTVQIDEIEKGVKDLRPLLKGEDKISFLANSPEERKIHFEAQYILAPLIVHRGNQGDKYALIIENFNYPLDSTFRMEEFKEVKRVEEKRFNFILMERK